MKNRKTITDKKNNSKSIEEMRAFIQRKKTENEVLEKLLNKFIKNPKKNES